MREDRYFPAGQGHPAIAVAGEPLADEPDGWLPLGGESALDALRSLAREFASPRQPLWCPASLRPVASGTAQVFRVRPGQTMHVVGANPLAAELRRLLTAGAEPGWELHPVPGGRTPLHTLAAPLRHLSGNGRFYNLLDRSGFASVEEVAATPDECLMYLRNGGPGLVAAVRQAISQLGTRPPAARPAATLLALKVVVTWAAAERGARTAEDLIVAVSGTGELPPDVAAAWNHLRQLDLRQVIGLLLTA